MVKRLYYKLILLSIAVFCSSNNYAQPIKINLQEPLGSNFIESEMIEEVTTIPLNLENPRTIAEDMEMKYIDKNYFILDNKFKQCIYRFDEEGNLINNIGERTSDGKETNLPVLTNPIKFIVDDHQNRVEIFNFEESRVQRYGYDGKKYEKLPLSLDPSDFIRDKQGNYWIYTGWNNKETSYRLLRMDKNMKQLDQKMRLISKCTPTQGFSAFYETGNGICLWELLGNITYMIRKENAEPTFVFNYGTYQLPGTFHNMLPSESIQLLNNNGYYSMKKYMENESFAYFFLNFTSTSSRYLIHIIYDKKAKQSFIYNELANIGAFDKAHALTPDNELVFLVSPRKLRQLFANALEEVPEPFMNLTESIADVRASVILKIKLRSMSDVPAKQEQEETFPEGGVD
jgi:hypothetical protein